MSDTATTPELRCYHPRSCADCDRRGSACLAHIPGTSGHENCTGRLRQPLLAEAAAALAATSTKDLLRQAYALTHRIDRADRHEVPATDLRAQRDLIDAEVLRRTREGV